MIKTDSILFTVFVLFAVSFFGMIFYEIYGSRNLIDKLFFWGLKLVNFSEEWGDFKFPRNTEVKQTISGKFKVINERQHFLDMINL